MIKIDLEFEQQAAMDFLALKSKILRIIRKELNFWGFSSRQDAEREINRTQNIEELVHLLKEKYL